MDYPSPRGLPSYINHMGHSLCCHGSLKVSPSLEDFLGGVAMSEPGVWAMLKQRFGPGLPYQLFFALKIAKAEAHLRLEPDASPMTDPIYWGP